MEDAKADVLTLPYRTSPEDLIRLVEARARGRELAQIQTLGFPAQGFQGSLAAAYSFGLMTIDSGDLTPYGRELALASSAERPRVLRSALLRFQAYELLLEAIFSRGEAHETTIQWIETWWSTHGFGNSQTNRDEGAYVFGKFVDFSGLGTLLIGRRGKSTRLEWKAGAREAVLSALDGRSGTGAASESPRRSEEPLRTQPEVARESTAPPSAPTFEPQLGSARNVLSLSLAAGRNAQISLPETLTAAEKRRLLALIDLMVDVEDEVAPTSSNM